MCLVINVCVFLAIFLLYPQRNDGLALVHETEPIRTNTKWPMEKIDLQAPVAQRLDNAIHRINHYPVDSVVCFVDTYPLDSDLSSG